MIKHAINRLMRHKLFNRMIMAYLLMSLLTILILSVILYLFLSRESLDTAGQTSLANLNQTVLSAEARHEQMLLIGSHLLNEIEIQNFIYGKREDKVTTFRASLKIYRILSAYPSINSIELYNGNTDTYFNSLRPILSDKDVLHQNARELMATAEKESRIEEARLITINKSNIVQTYPVYTYVQRPFFFPDIKAILIINLDLSELHQEILSYHPANQAAETFVLNRDNQVIMHHEITHFLDDYSKQDYTARFFNEKESGFDIDYIGSTKYMSIYVYSDQLPWYFIQLKPYDMLVSELQTVRNTILIYALSFFFMTMGIYLLLTRKIFNPFRKIIDKLGGVTTSSTDIELLTRAVSQNIRLSYTNRQQNFDRIIYELITSKPDPTLSSEERQSILSQFKSAVYCLLLFTLDKNPEQSASQNKSSMPDLLFCFNNIASEILSKHYSCHSIILDEQRILVICGASEPSDYNSLKPDCHEIHDLFYGFFKQTLSAAAGRSVQSMNKFPEQYRLVQGLTKYRLFYGHKVYLDEEIIQPYLNNDAPFPYEITDQIIHAIRDCNSPEMLHAVSSFNEELYLTAPEHVHDYAIQIVYSVFAQLDNLSVKMSLPYTYIEKIINCDTISQITHILINMTQDVSLIISENQYMYKNHKHIQVIDDIKTRVSYEFDNPNLSLELISDQYNLSTEYIRKLFKQIQGISFSNYLNNFRLSEARRLLQETDMPIKIIGEKVGLLNTPYFFTIFKKTFGQTPANFRNMNRK